MKLSFGTIIIMAISVAFAILSFGYLHQYAPTMQAVDNYNQYHDLLQTEANKAPLAKRRVENARRAVLLQEQRWSAYVATRTPEGDVNRGGINLAVDPYQLTVDTQKFRNAIQRAVNVQVRKGGVKLVSQAPTVRGPASTDDAGLSLLTDFYNYPTIPFPVVVFDFGPVTVEGTYAQIEANVRSYKSMPHYLAVTDGLSITGTSPNLRGTYNLSIVGFIRGKDIFPPNTNPAGAALAVATAPTLPNAGRGGPGRGSGGD